MQEYQNQPFIANGSPVFDENYQYRILEPIMELHGFQIFRPLAEKVIDEKTNEEKEVPLYNGFIRLDIANGALSGDYSTIKIRNEKHELLGMYRGHIAQDRLAHLVNAIVPYFKDVFIVPENNIGLPFLNECRDFDWYTKIYRQQKMDQIIMKPSEVLGFNTNVKTKILIISDLDKVIREGDFEVSREEKEEIDHYYYDERGGMNPIAPYHDDLIIADALCVQGVKMGVPGSCWW